MITAYEDHVIETTTYRDNLALQIESPQGKLTVVDKILYYFLVHIVVQENKFKSNHITISLDELAKNVLFPKITFTTLDYENLMVSFEKLKLLNFQTNVSEKTTNTIDYFSLLSVVTLNRDTNLLEITFNDMFVDKIIKVFSHHNKFDFYGYRTLSNEATSLYDYVILQYTTDLTWHYSLNDLQIFFPDHIFMKKLIDEINEKTTLKIYFSPDGLSLICNLPE